MARSPVITPPRPTPPARVTPSATRIDFAADPSGAGERMLRRYADPRPAVAVSTPVAAVPPTTACEPTADDALLVLFLPDRSASPLAAAWLAEADPDRPRPIGAPVDGGRVDWRAGRAVVAGPVSAAAEVVLGLCDFAFYEAELRAIEAALPAFERAAAEDVRLAFHIDDGDHRQWGRLGRTMESLASLRLTFARLEPHLGQPSRSLPPAGRQAFRRLAVRADVEDRLVAASDRLEACEDLYEGAVDRITDHRWWRKGHLLEAIIVVLLAIEGLQLAGDLALRLWQARGH